MQAVDGDEVRSLSSYLDGILTQSGVLLDSFSDHGGVGDLEEGESDYF